MGLLLRRCAAATCVGLLCAAGRSSPDSPASNDSEILRSFQAREYARAADLIEQSLRTSPSDALMLYNAACARAGLKEYDLAGQFLLKAVQAGFKDFSHMRRDPDLEPMRAHAVFRALIDARDSADALLAKREVDRWRKEHGDEHYRYLHDEARRIWFITSLDEDEQEAMSDMLDRQAVELARSLFGNGARHCVIIAVPTPADAAMLLPNRHVHGTYRHMKGLLIAADTGASLRHEFVHALHHNHMDQLGQEHPLWIQEGLAALYEDYEIRDDGSLEFLANERRNVVKAMARDNKLLPLDAFISQSDDAFADEPARNYVQARAVFEYLADRGKLGAWYAEYVQGFRSDATGGVAFRSVFGQPLTDIEREWRAWLDAKPTIVTNDAVKPAIPPVIHRGKTGDS